MPEMPSISCFSRPLPPGTPKQAAVTPAARQCDWVQSRIAWASPICLPQLPQRRHTQTKTVIAPPQVGLPTHIDLQTLDRFVLEPLRVCAARQHRAGLPYVYMHVAARTGPRHARIDTSEASAWLSVDLEFKRQSPPLCPPALSYTECSQPSLAHIDNIFFFCLVGADCQPQWLGSMAQAAASRVTQLIITTLLIAERGEPQALLRAGLLFKHGLGVTRNSAFADFLTHSAHVHDATHAHAAAARASLLVVPQLRWLNAAFDLNQPIEPSLSAHELMATLSFAVRLHNEAAVATLLTHGLDVDTHWPEPGDTDDTKQPMFAAIKAAAPSILGLLLQKSRLRLGPTSEYQRRLAQLYQCALEHSQTQVCTTLDTYFEATTPARR